MRRALIAKNHPTHAFSLALRLAAQQSLDPGGQSRNVLVLPGDHIAEIVDHAHDMRQFFLDLAHWMPPLSGSGFFSLLSRALSAPLRRF